MDENVEANVTEAVEQEATFTMADLASLDGDSLDKVMAGEQLDEEPLDDETDDHAEVSDDEVEQPEEGSAEGSDLPEGDEESDKPEPGSELESQYKNLEWKYGQQARELGELRQRRGELEELIQKFVNRKTEVPEEDSDDWDDPRSVAREEYGRMRAEEVLERQKSEEMVTANREAVTAVNPDFDENLVWDAIKSDGVPEEQIEQMKSQLWNSAPVLVHAQYQRGLLMRDNKALRDKVAELQGQLEGKSKRIAKNIKAAANRRAPVTQTAAAANDAERELSADEIHSLSYAQLEELLNRS